MKKIVFVNFIIASFLFSCSDSVPINESNPLAGIWQQIGQINIKDGKFNDTLFYSDTRLARPKIKFIGNGMGDKINSSWFRSARTKDSVRTTTSYDGESYYSEWYVASRVEIKNDSLISYPVYYHDYGRTNQRRKRIFENGYVHKRKLLINEDYYTQYSVDKNGGGTGELWKRIDHVGKNPTRLTGVFERDQGIFYRKNGDIDTVDSKSTPLRHNFFMFGDTKIVRVLNAVSMNDKGKDMQQGQALLAEYSLKLDTLTEKIIWGTKRFQGPILPSQFKNNARKAIFKSDDSSFSLVLKPNSKITESYIQYFKKIE